MGKICAFFGHRNVPYYLAENKHIERAIISLIENEGVDTCWFGGNGDFDSYAGSAARNVQKYLYPHIKRIFIAAYQQQIFPVSGNEIFVADFYYDDFIYPDEVECAPKRFAITYRNRYEVEHADFFICYITKEYGGAYDAFKLAKRRNKIVINLADDEDVKRSEIKRQKEFAELKRLYGNKPL